MGGVIGGDDGHLTTARDGLKVFDTKSITNFH